MKASLKTAFAVIFWIAVWQIAAMIVQNEILLPTVPAVFRALWSSLLTKEFYISVLLSLARVLAGFGLGAITGALAGSLSYASKAFRFFISPLMSAVKTAPIASVIILLIFWVGRDLVPSAAAFIVVLPLVYGNVLTGLENTDKNLKEMADVYGMSRKNRICRLYAPLCIPYFSSACMTGMGMGWKAAVAAEVICNPKLGIGSALYDGKVYLDMPSVLSWTLTVILLSALCEWLLKLCITLLGRRVRA